MYHELRKRGTGAADLKFLHRLQQARLGTSNRKAAPEPYTGRFPFASEVRVRGCAMYHELRKRGTGAADLKFLHRLPQARLGTSNRKAALEPYTCECPFASEVRVRGCCHVSRTSEAGHSS